MIIASSIRILEHSSSNLILMCAPLYVRGTLFAVAALIPFAWSAVYTYRRYDYARSMLRNSVALVAAILLSAPLVFAASESFSASRITFSGRDGMMVLDRLQYGLPRGSYCIPLAQIKHVTVQPSGSDSYALRIELASGRTFVVSGHIPDGESAKIGDALKSFVATN